MTTTTQTIKRYKLFKR